jgi:DNA-binding transcriptional LysR family regulator
MELRQLRYFVAVAETGNISRAARKMFLTQPALSRQIKALEDEIGLCLLGREAHSIHLTAAGEALLSEARDLLQRAEGIADRVRAAGQSVRLRVGYAPSLASGLLSGAVANFSQKHPNARVELFDLSTRELLSGLENGTLDVAITVRRERDGHGLKWTQLAKVPWRLAVNAQNRLAKRAQISPAEVADEALLVFCKRDYPEYWDVVTAWLREQRQPPTIAGEYDGVNSLLAAVESGLGVAMVTTNAVGLIPKNVRLRTLSRPPPQLCIAAGHRSGRAVEKPLVVLIEELRQAAQAFVGTDI